MEGKDSKMENTQSSVSLGVVTTKIGNNAFQLTSNYAAFGWERIRDAIQISLHPVIPIWFQDYESLTTNIPTEGATSGEDEDDVTHERFFGENINRAIKTLRK